MEDPWGLIHTVLVSTVMETTQEGLYNSYTTVSVTEQSNTHPLLLCLKPHRFSGEMRLERLPLMMWRIMKGSAQGKANYLHKTFHLRVGWGSRDSTFIWQIPWLATNTISAKGHKTHTRQPEWQNCKSKARQVAPMLTPELLPPITRRDILSKVFPMKETGLAEIA